MQAVAIDARGWVRVLYPESRWVSPEQVIRWAQDEATDAAEDSPETLEDAIAYLQDSGSVTFCRSAIR